MKKEIVIDALKNAGIELDEEKFKEFYKTIQVANGEDINNAKKDSEAKDSEIADLKAKLEAEVKSHEKGGEKYIDANEVEELRKFKTETINARNLKEQDVAIKKLLENEKYKFDKKAVSLLSMIARQEGVKFDDKNEISNADEFMSNMTTKYKDYIVTETMQGANPATTLEKSKEKQVDNLTDAIKEKYDHKGE